MSTLTDYFNSVSTLPDIRVPATRTSRATTVPSNPRRLPTSLAAWSDLGQQTDDFWDPLLNNQYPNLQPNPGFAGRMRAYSGPASESEIVTLASHAFEEPVWDILSFVFEIETGFHHHRNTINLGNPDRVFARTGAPSSSSSHQGTTSQDDTLKARLVFEFKAPWELELPDDLAKEYNDNEADGNHKVVKALHQLYGYMTWNDIQIGVLSTYESTFFFQRDIKLGLRVSRKYKHSDTGSRSVVAALAYLCHYVSTTGYHYCSPTDDGSPPGTHVMTFDPGTPLLHDGTWQKGLVIPWRDMQIRLHERLSQNFATVILAELRHRDHQSLANKQYEKPVVCKIYDLSSSTSAEQARVELKAYKHLESLQGKVIPRLFAAGLYWGMLQVFVLERCGDPVPPKPPRGFWSKVKEAVDALHNAFVIHGDLSLDNFTIVNPGSRDYEVRLMDFGISYFLIPRTRSAMREKASQEIAQLQSLRKEFPEEG
ncbi:hypothetical protein ABW21_db0205219 [Orbilia brochopaga]|nr:hypothetical protein ABW21_db0205219 [Drechslerella brochopaga]